jgi:4-diphosphocytidyl-2-C-methyl-D-erythritol kinase
MRLVARAPGKVNLCLFLGPLRDDGRHEIVTLFESVSLADEVEMTTRAGLGDEVSAPGVEGPNIVSRALEGLRARGWDAPSVRVRVEKRVPIAAGMGGGSADAAAVLRIAQRLSPLPEPVVAELAASLGADVPSQLTPGLTLGVGAGDEVHPREPLQPHAFVFLPQPRRLPTSDVYAEADRISLPRDRAALEEKLEQLSAGIASGSPLPAALLVNDLERAAQSLCSEIAVALQSARAAGADHALVCGSGPTVAGLYWGADCRDRAKAAAATLAERYPGAASAAPVSGDFGFPLFA